MIRSLIGLPFRLSVRYAGAAVHGATEVVERALGLVGVASTVVGRSDRPDVDLDGSPHDGNSARRSGAAARRRPAPRADAPPPPAPPAPAPPSTQRDEAAAVPPPPPPAPTEIWSTAIPPDAPDHVSEEATLVDSVAETGAEDGAGAQVHVAEPWDGYSKLKANEIIERLSGASTAELAAVDLFERSGRARQTILLAVERELKRPPG